MHLPRLRLHSAFVCFRGLLSELLIFVDGIQDRQRLEMLLQFASATTLSDLVRTQ